MKASPITFGEARRGEKEETLTPPEVFDLPLVKALRQPLLGRASR